jgi:pSer/pThr/pTyr-binding forkhead associated (FHA) protein
MAAQGLRGAAAYHPDRRGERNYMPVIKVNNQQFSLPPGQTRLGSGSDADVRLSIEGAPAVQAIVEVSNGTEAGPAANGVGRASSRAVIRRAADGAMIRINGVALGVEPMPLMHGDKVEIGGQELLYSDETKGGATELLAPEQIEAPRGRAGTEGTHPTASSGGRLLSLVDGKEYTIPATGITIGRDASNDVVIAKHDVSRIHAEIVPVANGYELRDRSTNGMLVNGALVPKTQVLSRGDVIRIGSEEFRFSADALPSQPSRPRAPAPAGADARQTDDPIKPPSDLRRPLLAVLEVGTGNARGVHELTRPVVHIGRGPHNDVVIDDVSVSEAHATFQLRNDGWYLVDLATTNGTHVNGTAVEGERKLHGSPVIRFGSVTGIFRPRDSAAEVRKGAHVIAGADRPQLYNTLATSMAAVPGGRPSQPQIPPPEPEQPGIRSWVWISAILAVIAAVAFFVFYP